MTTEPLFMLRDVRKAYRRGKQTVGIFDGLSLDIGRNEFVALMGPSGSGKTTLLNLLGGLDRPDGGEIRFDGERIDGFGEAQLSRWRRRHVGMVFQSYNLMPTLNAAQNVELPLLLTALSKAQRTRNVRTALELVGLADRAGHRPRELSGGQQQRVAIARALVTDPDLILADEPTGDLDRENANAILDLFALLHAEMGRTVVMVTHDPEAARRARRVLHLDKGHLVTETELAA